MPLRVGTVFSRSRPNGIPRHDREIPFGIFPRVLKARVAAAGPRASFTRVPDCRAFYHTFSFAFRLPRVRPRWSASCLDKLSRIPPLVRSCMQDQHHCQLMDPDKGFKMTSMKGPGNLGASVWKNTRNSDQTHRDAYHLLEGWMFAHIDRKRNTVHVMKISSSAGLLHGSVPQIKNPTVRTCLRSSHEQPRDTIEGQPCQAASFSFSLPDTLSASAFVPCLK
jgi:hypothetical protein